MKKTPILLIAALWAALTLGAWLHTPEQTSQAERRPLAQMPQLTEKNLISGSFMADFGDYAVDQFPLRQSFRGLKARVHTGLLRQKDMNGVYLYGGQAVKQEYPLDTASVSHAGKVFGKLYDRYLRGAASIHLALVPDKNYYLAAPSGHLSLDYEALFAQIREAMPWAAYTDLTDTLTADSYYRTDAHWRQETLLPAAGKLSAALGIPAPKAADYTPVTLEKPFYGVYYGQAALPLEPDGLTVLTSPLLEGCTVYDHETGKTTAVYDMDKLGSRDLYDVYLSGAKALLTVENPEGPAGKELIVFRDSFGSSLTPLLLQGYSRVTLVDVRYVNSTLLGQFLDFNGKDVLFLYSATVLNQSGTLQ